MVLMNIQVIKNIPSWGVLFSGLVLHYNRGQPQYCKGAQSTNYKLRGSNHVQDFKSPFPTDYYDFQITEIHGIKITGIIVGWFLIFYWTPHTIINQVLLTILKLGSKIRTIAQKSAFLISLFLCL